MTGRHIGAVAGILLGGIGCMKADRLVAVQNDVFEMDAGEDAAWDGVPFCADGGHALAQQHNRHPR